MKLTHRQRKGQREKELRIAFSQEEITADLNYPSRQRTPRDQASGGRRGDR